MMNSSIILNLFIFINLVWISSISTKTIPRQLQQKSSGPSGRNETDLPWIRDFNCFDMENRPHILDLPHPYHCHLFIKCSEHWPGVPIGVEWECPKDINGQPLYFSMETCNCEYQADALCYDMNNSSHVENEFKCACPLIQDKDGAFVPNPNDDRCSQGH